MCITSWLRGRRLRRLKIQLYGINCALSEPSLPWFSRRDLSLEKGKVEYEISNLEDLKRGGVNG